MRSNDPVSRDRIDFDQKFAGLRRAIELEQVELEEGKSSDKLAALQEKWRDVIKESPPLPEGIYGLALKQMRGE